MRLRAELPVQRNRTFLAIRRLPQPQHFAAPTGAGIADLLAALDELVASTPAALDRGRPRLWVDRVFAARGSGTVVTGTLTGGALAVDDHVVVGPEASPARVRAIQTHGASVESIGPGNRVALNLAGIDHGVVRRGEDLVAVWRDMEGRAHAVSAACTHKGCTVTWNTADGTWDCPCHGSVFEANGAVIHGPARAALPIRDL